MTASLHEPYSPYAAGTIKLPAPGALLPPPTGSGPVAAAPATPSHGGGTIPAVGNGAAAGNGPSNADVWGVLHQMVSTGQLDAAQLLQVVQAMNPQSSATSAPSRQHSQTLKAAAVPPASPGGPNSGSAESLDGGKSRTASGSDAPGAAADGTLQVLRAASGGPASPDPAALSCGGAAAGGAAGGGPAPGASVASEGRQEASPSAGTPGATQPSTSASPQPAGPGASDDPQAAVLQVLQRLELVSGVGLSKPAEGAPDAAGATPREAAEQQQQH